jgi:hypothetical protein
MHITLINTLLQLPPSYACLQRLIILRDKGCPAVDPDNT